MGDDLPDIPVMQVCGCGAAPADAVEEALEAADFICTKAGGKGCVRETVQMTMKIQGTWFLDVQDYKQKF
jgi:3-deoxy-D-manno-octulosonate 8-phosphate phosphatase (KDO 8-P phosphatase)